MTKTIYKTRIGYIQQIQPVFKVALVWVKNAVLFAWENVTQVVSIAALIIAIIAYRDSTRQSDMTVRRNDSSAKRSDSMFNVQMSQTHLQITQSRQLNDSLLNALKNIRATINQQLVEEIEAGRPRIQIGVQGTIDSTKYKPLFVPIIKTTYTNTGKRSGKNFVINGYLVNSRISNYADDSTIDSTGNDFEPTSNVDITFTPKKFGLLLYGETFYTCTHYKYTDEITKKTFQKSYFVRWSNQNSVYVSNDCSAYDINRLIPYLKGVRKSENRTPIDW
jgi:hypothetical protein